MDFKRPLVAAVRSADRVAVDPRPPWDRGKEPPPLVLEGRDRIEAFLETLDFQFSLRALLSFPCRCLGDLAIDFREGDSTLATLTYHHGTHLRWHDGPWGSDVYLTPDSRTRLDGWLLEQGYDRLQARREARREREMPEDVETGRFYGYFPKGRIEDLKGDGKELARTVFRAFSVVSRPWGVTGNKEQRAIEALSNISGTDLLAALGAIEDDREALLGFARFFFFHGYDEKVPESERDAWALRLAGGVLQQGHEDDRSLVMRRLWVLRTPDADAFLRSVLDGKYGGESAEGEYGEPGLPAQAALGLALRGDASVKDRLPGMLEDTPTRLDRAALEVTRAALGDPSYLKAEHLRLGSHSVGFGGLRVIEMCAGAHGMDALVHGAFEHPWASVGDEAILVFERITGQVVWNRAPNSRPSKDTALAWWKENGEAFMTERRAGRARDKEKEP